MTEKESCAQGPVISTDRTDLAAFLLAKNNELVSVEKEGSRVIFFFANPGGKATAAQVDYFAGGTVAAITFCEMRRRVMSLVWQYRRKQTEPENDE
jgi:hypothetical protein